MFIKETFLESVGLSACLFYDQYHLLHSVWKKSISTIVYDRIYPELEKILNSETKEKFDATKEDIWSILDEMDAASAKEQLKLIINKPDNIGFYHVASIRGSLMKKGSSHAEQNHASIDHNIHEENLLEAEEQVKELLQRQGVILSTKNNADLKYGIRSGDKCKEYETNGQHMMAEACKILSYNAMTLLETESNKIPDLENQVLLCDDRRCTCVTGVCHDIQCVHELFRDGGFNETKWATRHFKEEYYEKQIGYHF